MTKTIRFAALALLTTLCACDPDDEGQGDGPIEVGILPAEVDVSENMTRFVFDEAPVFEDGMPAYGNWFITQGYLYPGGYLDGEVGVAPDGTPAHPEAVIGTWTCRGVFVGDGAHTADGPVVITTQYFDFYDEPGFDPDEAGGGMALITEGFESIALGEELLRAVTGGTGPYVGAGGEARQTFLGFNDAGGVELRIDFEEAHSGS